jgi:hypothetical protein
MWCPADSQTIVEHLHSPLQTARLWCIVETTSAESMFLVIPLPGGAGDGSS